MFFERTGLRVFVYKSEIDMRCGFERLHSLCVHQMQAIMDQGHVYLFFGKNRRRLKVLFYDGTGLVLIAKRIEGGRFMRLGDLLGRNPSAYPVGFVLDSFNFLYSFGVMTSLL